MPPLKNATENSEALRRLFDLPIEGNDRGDENAVNNVIMCVGGNGDGLSVLPAPRAKKIASYAARIK